MANKCIQLTSGANNAYPKEALRSGEYTPQVKRGADGLTTTGFYWYRVGNLVTISIATWDFTLQNPNSETLYLSLPFRCVSTRAYGGVGYFNSRVAGAGNLVTLVIGNNNDDGFSVVDVSKENRDGGLKGTEYPYVWQASFTYITDED